MLGDTELRAVLLFRNDKDKDEDYIKVYEQAAKANVGEFVFMIVGTSDEDSLQEIKNNHLKLD